MTDYPNRKKWLALGSSAIGGAALVLAGIGVAHMMNEEPEPDTVAAASAEAAVSDSASPTMAEATSPTVTDTASPTSEVTATSEGTAAQSYCGSYTAEAASFSDPPEDVIWAEPWGTLLPMSATHGPSVEDRGVPVCWSHTTEGAVLAAIWQGFGIQAWPEYVDYALPPGDERDAMRKQVENVGEPETQSLYGYRIISAGNDFVEVHVVNSPSVGRYEVMPMAMEWRDNDWRINIEKTGETFVPDTVEGYTSWAWHP